MIARIALALGFLATACAVVGEDDPGLEEIDYDVTSGTETACSTAPPDPGEPGSLTVVSLEKDGRNVSYTSLTRYERWLLDTTIRYTETTVGGEEGKCVFEPGGWWCDTGDYYCSCEHTSTGPECRCDAKC